MPAISKLLIAEALDGLHARQLATAQNIANASSEGYRPIRVSFEESLRAAAAHGPAAISRVTPRTDFAPMTGIASELRLDLEVATASQTAMRYGALINVLEGRSALMRSVLSGGR
jgi:flagellar basal-body rod protein FlgB